MRRTEALRAALLFDHGKQEEAKIVLEVLQQDFINEALIGVSLDSEKDTQVLVLSLLGIIKKEQPLYSE